MAETQTYSHTDIQRYLQHKMSPQEMHEFEKALMNDPFLADALEGFSASDAALAEAHIAAIERSLTNDQQKAKVVPLAVQKTAWWKVAAIIFIIVSAGVITYSVVNNGNTVTHNNQIAATAPVEITTEKDSISAVNKPLAQIEALPQKQLLPNKNSTSPIIRSAPEKALAYERQPDKEHYKMADSITDNKSLMAALAAPVPAVENKAALSSKMEAKDEEVVVGYGTRRRAYVTGTTLAARSFAQNEFKGKITDKSGDPLPYASIKANNSIATVADANGNFIFRAPDSVVHVNVSSAGYAAAETYIRSNKPDTKIALHEDELSLAEVVVTNLSKKKKNNGATVRVDSSIAAEPVGGWKSFKQYLNQQLDSLKATDNEADFDEDIVLEFSIDKQGHPTDIKAPAEINALMAEKAIQILSNGPKWKNRKKDKKVKVIIAF